MSEKKSTVPSSREEVRTDPPKEKLTKKQKKKAAADKKHATGNDTAATKTIEKVEKGTAPSSTPKIEKSPVKVRVIKKRPNSSVYALVLTVVYLLFVVAVSVLLSVFALDVAKEAFAINKNGEATTITLSGDYITIEELAEQLTDQHIINHPKIFQIYAVLRNKSNTQFVAGVYPDIPAETGYDGLLALFSPKTSARKEITVSIPEGFTVDDIIDLCVEKYGIGTREGFEYVINEYPFKTEDYWFLEGVECTEGRIYRLEGYLYPDTYRFYDSYKDAEGDIPGTAAAKAVVTKMLNEFSKNFKKSYLTKSREYLKEYYPNAPEMTLDEILTLASILEKEGLPAERVQISAVFYNRLCNPSYEGIGGKLQSNVTVLYQIRHDKVEFSTDSFTDFERNYPTPYNTYLNEGLPPGPIVSPTIESINAALYPLANCQYYYFVTSVSGYSFFAETYDKHQRNIERALAGVPADPYSPEEDDED